MTYQLRLEMAKVKAKTYDPNLPGSIQVWKNPATSMRNQWAIVVNNKDPDKKGRLQLHFPQWGGNIITGWVPVIRPFSGVSQGMWMLPEIGEKVLCIFINDNPDKPLVMGTLYSTQQPPPVRSNDGNNLKIFTTKSGSEIILDDTDGAETIRISMKDGKMRMVLDVSRGVQVINELGDINVECRKLTAKADEDALFDITTKVSFTANKDITIESAKALEVLSAADVVCKGKEIKITGASGVCAKNKQVASKDDQVVGIDQHDIQVPSSSGLTTVPMVPHPYVGKLVDKLSQNVKLGSRNVATKGSKSKANSPLHLPMPPGVKFKKTPNNEGVVSSGTIPTVKVNGKEVAVLGSAVKTCADPQPAENCKIIALGAAVRLPIQIPVTNPINRSLVNPHWSTQQAKSGEAVKLLVSLQNQYAGATVKFKVFPEGANPDTARPLAVLFGKNEANNAEGLWCIPQPPDDATTAAAKYFFTVESFGCAEVRTGNLSVQMLTWAELLLYDVYGKPAAGLKCVLKDASGVEFTVHLDENGYARVKGVVHGQCSVKFPTIKESSVFDPKGVGKRG